MQGCCKYVVPLCFLFFVRTEAIGKGAVSTVLWELFFTTQALAGPGQLYCLLGGLNQSASGRHLGTGQDAPSLFFVGAH